MAQIANPHKKFQFSIFVFGMNPFLAQKVTLPERSVEQVEHGEGNHVIKTGGMVKLGNITIDKIQNSSFADKLFWGWISLVQNEVTGGGVIPEIYKKAIQVQFLGNDGVTVLSTRSFIGAWPCKINGIELDRLSSDNTIESIEISIDQEVNV